MPARTTRRRLLAALGAAGVGLVGARLALPRLWVSGPPRPLSARARAFVERCFAGVDRAAMWDLHAHLVGLGGSGSGCEVNPELQSHLHPVKRMQFDFYRNAAGIDADATADEDYVSRLLAVHRAANPAGRLVLLAFDRHVTEDGVEAPARSPFYTPNDYVLRLAREHDELVAACSVHPYRPDAVERLDRAAEGGARAVKWLPNAMGIDPASPRCDRFYARLAELDLPLITHAGRESAVDAREQQRLGNPLRLRRALDAGVRLVVAHCGSLGEGEDLDAPGPERPRRENLDLFLRLMDEPQYSRRLYGEISAITFVNRAGDVLREVLAATEIHDRLVNGSDYPLPAIDPVISTRLLAWRGLLDDEDRALCEEVFDANALLFDFVVKRSLRLRDGGGERRFPASVFETAGLLA